MAKKKSKQATKASDFNYKSIPALAAYIDRIGAEQQNFRRFQVREYVGKYYTEKALIKISADGIIECRSLILDHQPTPEEAEAIRVAIAGVVYPKSIGATKAQLKVLERDLKGSIYYPIWSRRENAILMVQERRETDKGKVYIPWSMWSDGKWRPMEPDGALPFYKPEKKSRNAIMVHEGAKATKAAQEASQPGSGHPWQIELAAYEHWGILGGAMALHRADYNELIEETPSEVVYFCDNDQPGKDAVDQISTCWGRSLKYIFVGEAFPVSWDLADPMPEGMFDSDGKYKGPIMRDMIEPATRATVKEKDEEGKAVIRLLPQFIAEWRHTIDPEFYININIPHRLYTRDSFDSKTAPFSHAKHTSDYLRRKNVSKSEGIDYRPDLKPGIYSSDKGLIINVFRPTSIRPEHGDCSLWFDYLNRIFPIKSDREEVMKWCATLIARPDIRMQYSMLLISETQGVGKTTLGEKILKPLVGEENASTPNEDTIVESAFNSWVARKRLAVVGEIYAGHSKKAYNRLKGIVADDYIEVNEKFVKGYTIRNWLHIVASSNSMKALSLDMEDRRWLIPKVTEEVQPAEFWMKLNKWIEGSGLSYVYQWALDYVQEEGFVRKGQWAPKTAAKEDVINENLSPGQLTIARTLEKAKEKAGEGAIILLDTALIEVVKQEYWGGRPSDKLEKPATARKLAKKRGWFVGSKNAGCKTWGLTPFEAVIISNRLELAQKTPKELAEMGLKPMNLLDDLDL